MDGNWDTQTIDSDGYTGYDTSIGLDSRGAVHISYYDDTDGDLRYATDAGGAWLADTVDASGVTGWFTSLAVDATDGVHIAYYDSTLDEVRYATGAPGDWETESIAAARIRGNFISLGLDSRGAAHVVYPVGGDLVYATNPDGQWAEETVDALGTDVFGDTGGALVIDDRDTLHLTYRDSTSADLRYARRAIPDGLDNDCDGVVW